MNLTNINKYKTHNHKNKERKVSHQPSMPLIYLDPKPAARQVWTSELQVQTVKSKQVATPQDNNANKNQSFSP